MIKSLSFLLLFIFINSTISIHQVQKQAPIWPQKFSIVFEQQYLVDNQKKQYEKVTGQMYYDFKNNRQRIDFNKGKFNKICNSIMPNSSTPCTQIVNQNKRWILFPYQHRCCFCCDSQHGCGVVNNNWLKGAQYKGVEKINQKQYDKWSLQDIQYWATNDQNQIPKKFNNSNNTITNYFQTTFSKNQFSNQFFNIPYYCTESCPLTTICGSLRG